MQTLKDMIFGKRSERLAALVAEQLALELGDLETGATPPAPANDDAPAAQPSGKPRKKARRNIGALPRHLPRCEQVLEPDTFNGPIRLGHEGLQPPAGVTLMSRPSGVTGSPVTPVSWNQISREVGAVPVWM
jgi:hypothetical protein